MAATRNVDPAVYEMYLQGKYFGERFDQFGFIHTSLSSSMLWGSGRKTHGYRPKPAAVGGASRSTKPFRIMEKI